MPRLVAGRKLSYDGKQRPTTSSSTALFTHSYLSITSDINHYPTRAPSLSSKHSSTPPVSGGSYGKARSAPSAHPSASSARHAELLSPSQLAPRPPRPSSRLSKIFKSEGRTKVAGVDSSQSRLKAAATSSNFPSTPYRPSDPSLSPTGITPTFAPSTPMSAESTSLASSPNTLLSPAPSPPTSSLTSESTPISASPNEQVSSSLSSLASLASAQAEASDPSGSPSPTAFVMGGKKLSVLPIGLGVLGGVVAVGLLVSCPCLAELKSESEKKADGRRVCGRVGGPIRHLGAQAVSRAVPPPSSLPAGEDAGARRWRVRHAVSQEERK